MLELCINDARQLGYKQMYLETLDQMLAARGLYEKFGFKQISTPMGNTGHYSCDIFYIKILV
ncbi:MAG: GNAT family N-acetyltransferase [Bacteroidales bacterium]|nr:GNAT family N-acetyltransferase [Bacteroidales bacterium]